MLGASCQRTARRCCRWCGHPAAIVALATIISYLVANLRGAITNNAAMVRHMRRLEASVEGGEGGGLITHTLPAGNLAPVPASAAKRKFFTGGIGWNGEDAALLRSLCGAGRAGSFFVQELWYPRDAYLGPPWRIADHHAASIAPLVSLHSPVDD